MLHKPLSPSLNYTSRVRGSDGSGDIGGGVIVGVALISRLVILLVRRVVLGHRVWAIGGQVCIDDLLRRRAQPLVGVVVVGVGLLLLVRLSAS